MRVLVIGAGVGGLALARGLRADGHDVVVYEQADGLRAGGAALTLASNGTGILRALGVSLDGAGARIDVLESRGYDGARLARVRIGRSAERYGHPNVTMPRRRLLERLADGLPADVIRFGRSCTGIEYPADGGGTVRVTFADGSSDVGDVVVGADGRNSVVRAALWGHDPAVPGEFATWQGVSPIDIDVAAGQTGLMLVGPAGFCGLMPCGEGLLQWWFDVRWKPGMPLPESPVKMLREQFAGWAEPVPEVLAAITDEEAGFFPHVRQAVPRTWGRGPVTLLGDAVHSMPPTRAQGANQALEDAWSLAQELRSVTEVQVAAKRTGDSALPRTGTEQGLRAYEHARTPKVRIVAKAAGTEDIDYYRPRLVRAVPDGFAAWYYTKFLGQVSNYLAGQPRRG